MKARCRIYNAVNSAGQLFLWHGSNESVTAAACERHKLKRSRKNRRRVRERPFAEIHAVSSITRESGQQERGLGIEECSAVGHSKAAVDGSAQRSTTNRSHVNLNADNVARNPFVAVSFAAASVLQPPPR
jgi:hypothetical protein